MSWETGGAEEVSTARLLEPLARVPTAAEEEELEEDMEELEAILEL